MRDQLQLVGAEALNEPRIRRDEPLGLATIPAGARREQALRRRRPVQEQLDDVAVAQLPGCFERRHSVIEHPARDVAAAVANLLGGGRPIVVMGDAILALAGPVIEGVRIVAKAALDQLRIAQADAEEDVEPRAALNQQA